MTPITNPTRKPQIIWEKLPEDFVLPDESVVENTLHPYRVIRIWEWDPSQPELLPLAVLAKSEQPEVLLSQVAERIDRIENKRKRSNIAACVELLAGINYSSTITAFWDS